MDPEDVIDESDIYGLLLREEASAGALVSHQTCQGWDADTYILN